MKHGYTIYVLMTALLWGGIAQAQEFPVPYVDNYEAMIRLLGQPTSTELATKGNNYIYPEVTVHISGLTQEVHSLTFTKPNVYTKYTGIDVGVNIQQLRTQLKDLYELNTKSVKVAIDYEHGLIMWLDSKGDVKQLMQVHPANLKRIH